MLRLIAASMTTTSKAGTPWSPDEAILANRLRLAGLSCAEIADYLPGRTTAAVRGMFNVLRSRGVQVAFSKATNRTTSKRVVVLPRVPLEIIKTERDAGLSLVSIAKKHGIGLATAFKYAKLAATMEKSA